MATQITQRSVDELRTHPDNPRYILDESFEKLKKSLEAFPDMMQKRPLIVNDKGEVLGGNMRLRAAKALGWSEVPTIQVDWPIDKQREFIIKDNSGFGKWDFDVLANEWNQGELADWGLEVYLPDETALDDFFNDDGKGEKPKKHIIVFEFSSQENLDRVKDELTKRDGSNETILINLLGL